MCPYLHFVFARHEPITYKLWLKVSIKPLDTRTGNTEVRVTSASVEKEDSSAGLVAELCMGTILLRVTFSVSCFMSVSTTVLYDQG